MVLSLKRGSSVNAEQDKENTFSESLSYPARKKPCHLASNKGGLLYTRSCKNSSSEDESSEDESSRRPTTLKDRNRLRNKRRNHRELLKNSLSSPLLDLKISKAVSQYSDDEDSHDSKPCDSRGSTEATSNNGMFSRRSSVVTSPANVSQTVSLEMSPKSRHSLPNSDFAARSRCFEYLVGAIDEAWARYCDATAVDEDEVYGYDGGSAIPQTPNSIALTSDEEEGYKSEISTHTNITEYESDYPAEAPKQATRRVSEVPANVRLQQLKDRLIKTKYYLQDFVDSDNINECLLFWKKWDLIKYATIELVEDDDDDEVIESTIEELESGRYFASIGA
ncbi:hypothetical protein OGAPHI_002589 [Ogataea philodendri]|uniref:Uncharacterized protein n=1 Tax=Ogataea philodendri TaxID=1378263 RepID=A0A9P8PCP3_9ASCO|nr:uncharacterized protein OGAPHI_002589 [Ogataea philodendri]KAH3668834.1 hypothetical protein OGAPHI_002589 [Ogataea philodendri]